MLKLITSAGLLLAIGATGAAKAANPNVPASSPYALLEVAPYSPDPGSHSDRGRDDRKTERRAAFTSAGAIYGRPGNDYGPGYEYPSPASPYKWAVSPEDFR
jgi:hypothetical protein